MVMVNATSLTPSMSGTLFLNANNILCMIPEDQNYIYTMIMQIQLAITTCEQLISSVSNKWPLRDNTSKWNQYTHRVNLKIPQNGCCDWKIVWNGAYTSRSIAKRF